MPLLDILGVDGLNQGFTVAVCFLNQEQKADYNWAIYHLRKLFKEGIWPSIIGTDCEENLMAALESNFPLIRTKFVICYWHVSMNVVRNCKQYFETAERWDEFFKAFQACVYANTIDEFNDAVVDFKAEFNWNNGDPHVYTISEEIQVTAEKDEERMALQYCLGRWLGTYKEKIAHAWVNQFFNGGTTTTSRLEGAHHVLKSWIGKPNKNLPEVWKAVQLATDHQFHEIQAKRAQAYSSSVIRTQHEFFAALHGQITPIALMLLYKQWKLALTEDQRRSNGDIITECSRTYHVSMGVPCWHLIKERIATGNRIQPYDFHPHWYWKKPPPGTEYQAPTPLILDPEARQRRNQQQLERRQQANEVRAHARIRRAQTGRILSQFEQIQPVLRHCSACIIHGHDKATCTGCRSTNHTRNACPIIPYIRRIAPGDSDILGANNSQASTNIEIHQKYSQIPQSQMQYDGSMPPPSNQALAHLWRDI